MLVSLLITINFFYNHFSTVLALMEQNEELPLIIGDLNLKVEKVYEGLEFPTSMAFLDFDDILVLEKDKGTVKRIINGNMLPEPLLDINVANQYERGMLGIAILKTDQQQDKTKGLSNNSKKYIFLYFTELEGSVDGGDKNKGTDPLGNRLYRYELKNDKLVNPKLLLDLPAIPNRHNGGSVLIGIDKNVYLTIGDLDHKTTAQNFENGASADGTSGILRITKDGKQVEDSVLGQGDPLNKYYAYGIRNSFGMDFDPLTGYIWATEDGFRNIDELNLIERGFNSGWRDIQGFFSLPTSDPEIQRRDSGTNLGTLVDFNGKGIYGDPKFMWNHSVTPTAVKFLNSDKYGEKYENDLFVGDFNYGYLYHFELDDQRKELILKGLLNDHISNNSEELGGIIFGQGFGGITNLNLKKHNYFGGITDIEVGPDGYIYILTFGETNGIIYKIVPS